MKKKETSKTLSVIVSANERFIHFLKNEFAISSFNASLQKNLREKPIALKKNGLRIEHKKSYGRISHLLNEALKHLNEEKVSDQKGDFDEDSAEKWQFIHNDVKKNIISNPKILSKTASRSDNLKKSGFVRSLVLPALFALLISILSVSLAPNGSRWLIASIDNVLYGQKNASGMIDPVAQNKVDDNFNKTEMIVAKALFIIKNQHKIDGRDEIGVSFDDLFRQSADAQEDVSASEESEFGEIKIQDKSKFDKISETVKISWLNFFKELSTAQERLFKDSSESE